VGCAGCAHGPRSPFRCSINQSTAGRMALFLVRRCGCVLCVDRPQASSLTSAGRQVSIYLSIGAGHSQGTGANLSVRRGQWLISLSLTEKRWWLCGQLSVMLTAIVVCRVSVRRPARVVPTSCGRFSIYLYLSLSIYTQQCVCVDSFTTDTLRHALSHGYRPWGRSHVDRLLDTGAPRLLLCGRICNASPVTPMTHTHAHTQQERRTAVQLSSHQKTNNEK